MGGKKGRSGGWNRVTPEEHRRRSNFKPSKHAESAPHAQPPYVLTPDEEAFLADLPDLARWQGRRMLTDYVVVDRKALRRYLLAFNIFATLPRSAAVPPERLAEAHAHAAQLLQELRCRPR